jgi:hypothetical protein
METVFWLVGGFNTLVVFSAIVFKPIRTWFFNRFKRPEEIQNERIILIEKNQERLNAGVRALLADRLHQSCLFFLDKQCISIGDMENVIFMYKEYKTLGGNGLIQNMVERVRQLQLTSGDRCYGGFNHDLNIDADVLKKTDESNCDVNNIH